MKGDLAKVLILAIFLIAAVNQGVAEQCQCEEIMAKLDLLLGNSSPAPVPQLSCKPIKGFGSINAKAPKSRISIPGGAHGLETKENQLFITSFMDGYVYSYDTTLPASELSVSRKRVDGRRPTPAFLDVHDDVLYVSHTVQSVINQIPLSGGEPKPITIKINNAPIRPIGIQVSPDGKLLVVGDEVTGKIFVFDNANDRFLYSIDSKQECGNRLRKIAFVSKYKFLVSTFGPKFCAFESPSQGGGRYQRVQMENPRTKSSQIDGFYVHCDGSVIVTDRAKGNLILMDKDLNHISTLQGLGAGIIDVTVTADGILAVSNFQQRDVKLYQLQ